MTLCKTDGVDDVYFIDLLDVGYIAKVIDCSGGVKTFIGCSAAVCQVIVRPSRSGGTEVQGIARLSFCNGRVCSLFTNSDGCMLHCLQSKLASKQIERNS